MDPHDLRNEVLNCGRRARAAARALAQMSTERKNAALLAMADQLCASASTILQANRKDLENATADQLSLPMIDRLTLDERRIQAMADGIRQVAALEDPVGKVIAEWTRPNGLHISKVRVPIGVIGIIYESRPNVTSDSAVLCTKTGNAVILRGGSESIRSNIAIAETLRTGASSAGLPDDSILLIPRTGRDAVRHMAEMDQYIDLIVPRGGRSLIETVVSYARMPVIKHYVGICIAYVDKEADLDMAVRIVVNAKTQRPGVCNAIETLLVHREIATPFLKKSHRYWPQRKWKYAPIPTASINSQLLIISYSIPLARKTGQRNIWISSSLRVPWITLKMRLRTWKNVALIIVMSSSRATPRELRNS